MYEQFKKYLVITGIIGLVVALLLGQLEFDLFDLFGLGIYVISTRLGGYPKWILEVIGIGIMFIITIIIVLLAIFLIFALSVVL